MPNSYLHGLEAQRSASAEFKNRVIKTISKKVLKPEQGFIGNEG